MERLDHLIDHLDERVEGFGLDTWISICDDKGDLYYEGIADWLYETVIEMVSDGIYLLASSVLNWRVTSNGEIRIKIKPKLDTDGRIITL